MTFKLADDTRYTPDFAVLLANGEMEMIDTKGGGPVQDDALVKIKCAAELFPQYKWCFETQKRVSEPFIRREFN